MGQPLQDCRSIVSTAELNRLDSYVDVDSAEYKVSGTVSGKRESEHPGEHCWDMPRLMIQPQANRDNMDNLVAQLRRDLQGIHHGDGGRARERHLARGKLLPRNRIQRLLDPGCVLTAQETHCVTRVLKRLRMMVSRVLRTVLQLSLLGVVALSSVEDV